MPWSRPQQPTYSGPSDYERAASEAGEEAPVAEQQVRQTHWFWKLLFPWLIFRNIKAGLYFVFSTLAVILIVVKVGWLPLIAFPVSAAFAWAWWKYHYHVEKIMIIEVRAEGQRFRKPHLPFNMRVTDSAFRVFFGPRKLYDRAVKYGVFEPVYEVPSYIVICDWFDPVKNVIIFNEDTDWTNFAVVAQLNQTLAKSLRRRGRKEDALRMFQRHMVALYNEGRIDKETLNSALVDTEQQLDIIRESPLTKRSFAHYFQDTIPRLKQQVMMLVKGIEEYAFALAAEMAYGFYNQPMTPQVEAEIKARKDKYGRMKMDIFKEFEWGPEFDELDPDAEVQAGGQQMHDLAQQSYGASNRAYNLPSQQPQLPVMFKR